MRWFSITWSAVRNRLLHKSHLEGNGERVDIHYKQQVNFPRFNMYQKSHYRRYEFARDLISLGGVCGDLACGTGYGSVMLTERSHKVIGVDINSDMIDEIRLRYEDVTNVEFVNANLLDLEFDAVFDDIVSFETIEHFSEGDISRLLEIYRRALKQNGKFIFSVPFMQQREAATRMGFHLTYCINETRIEQWLRVAGFVVECYKYQNYETHLLRNALEHRDFIVCVASKA